EASLEILFDCLPSHQVTLRVRDENDRPTSATFVIRDPSGRIYPSLAKRLAPDFAFHPQVYRGEGETLKLPQGVYTFEIGRGPKSLTQSQTVRVTGEPQTLSFRLQLRLPYA